MAFELGKTASGAKYIIGPNGNHIYLSQAGVKIKNEQSGGIMKDFLYVMNLGELIYSGPLDSVIYMGSPISSNPIDAINFLVAEGWVNFNSGSGGGTIDPQDYDLADFKNQSSDPFVQESDLTLKADLIGGKVPASQLPSYVDDVLEFADLSSFPVTGETGKLYVALDTNKLYRWSGSAYVAISSEYVPAFYPKITINSYSQDATDYILKVTVSNLQPSNYSSTGGLFNVSAFLSNPVNAVNIAVTHDALLGEAINIISTSPSISLGSFDFTIKFPKASNTSPIWNNQDTLIAVAWKGTDNFDGGTTSPFNPRRFANDGKIIRELTIKQDILVSGTNIKSINGTAILGSGNLDLNLQSVTDAGNETTNSIVSSSDIKGLSLSVESAIDPLFKGSFVANYVFGNYEYELPDKSGVVALISDVEALNLQAITGVGNETTNSIVLNGGDLEITDPNKNIIIKSPNGSRWKIEIDNSGVISTTLIP